MPVRQRQRDPGAPPEADLLSSHRLAVEAPRGGRCFAVVEQSRAARIFWGQDGPRQLDGESSGRGGGACRRCGRVAVERGCGGGEHGVLLQRGGGSGGGVRAEGAGARAAQDHAPSVAPGPGGAEHRSRVRGAVVSEAADGVRRQGACRGGVHLLFHHRKPQVDRRHAALFEELRALRCRAVPPIHRRQPGLESRVLPRPLETPRRGGALPPPADLLSGESAEADAGA
mmetsp:Transcript_4806/g.11562  ORF Transcript_4806/g.11562 Transcript_4806/m.11562 type:complete len:228 (-) Transcript_4806:1513-2196(-)